MLTAQPTLPGEAWRHNLGRAPAYNLQGPRPTGWWTGRAPEDTPGYRPSGHLHALPLLDLAKANREAVQAYFDNTWTLTEVLFSALADEEAFYRPPAHGLRHPMVFYLGHPACLYVNKLRVAGILDAPVNAELERLFETGVDEMSWDNMSKNDESWPAVEAVMAYRREVYGVVSGLIQTDPRLQPGASFADGSLLWALAMAFEHERIHLETSCVLIRELPLALVQRPLHWPPDHPSCSAEASARPRAGVDHPENPFVKIPAASLTLGKPADFPSFGWDNEYGTDTREVGAFEVSQHLVSHGEFHAFVEDGGYREARWWTPQGWSWRAFRNIKWPTFWIPDGPAGTHRFRLRLPFAEVPMPWSWPVEVNAHEAQAFASWRAAREGCLLRLPTEAEHHAIRGRTATNQPGLPGPDPVMHCDGPAMGQLGRNCNLAWGSPWPVDTGARKGFPSTPLGNLWTWLADDFHPLPEARLDPLYDDFSAPCYDGEHTMILGGSFVSTGDQASEWARFHFRPHFHQFAGIRLVKGATSDPIRVGRRGSALAVTTPAPPDGHSLYESKRLVDEYVLMHHGRPEDVMPWPHGPTDGLAFPQRCARLLSEACLEEGLSRTRALDLGCALGGASFELARDFAFVLGADWSEAFVEAADALRQQGQLSYFRRDEGDLGVERTVTLDPSIDGTRLRFERADAHQPPLAWEPFDAVLMANLVDRLTRPAECLAAIHRWVRPGGLLMLTTPYTWLAEFTPKAEWLGGVSHEGVARTGAEGVAQVLADHFERVAEHDMPFLIREHHRKFQWSVAHATIWRRK
ncbi:MAG: 5-histidylcysteine sulfoxide synthase [Candidatus Sericytochromatia bacterium]|nr:5-histidylcysteine sulfoxide synthase [Candidatus Sericytochromatia bacterium]